MKGVSFMRKRISSALVPLLLVCILSAQVAQAAEQRASGGMPDLFFQGTTAICSAICQGNSTKDSLDVTLTLYQGNTRIDSWSKSGGWKVSLSEECIVEYGKTYRLEMAYSINGVAKPVVSVTNTCC